jgi:putative ATP-dependent endonuclease of OLD family
MHLSRLYIKNFRSIKEVDLRFKPGKNVIIGRNNAGKSNIIRALDLVLGETSPTYARSENVTVEDFYAWCDPELPDEERSITPSDEIVIWCELSRDSDETLNYEEIYNCYGFKVYAEGRYPNKFPRRIDRTLIPEELPTEVFAINPDEAESIYVNPKLRNQRTFENQFDPCFCFAFAFYATRNSAGRISKEIRFLYRESENHDWYLAFTASVRNELLRSAIIPSFRDPQNQLRLGPWYWYGKLMRHLVGRHEDSADLMDALEQVKKVSGSIFLEIEKELHASTLQVAFPGTKLSIQLAADTKTSIYKNSIIYIDDGFKSPLTEKGAGIQSATIMGLFNYYTHHVNTTGSALLCCEEPELYLHPHARRVVSDRLDQFLETGRNQVILSTHSVEFVRSTREDAHLINLRRNSGNTTCETLSLKEIQRLLLRPDESEWLFADKVVVCEGFDEYVLRWVADKFFKWRLDAANVSIVAVGGKDDIAPLARIACRHGAKTFIMADFDFLLRDRSDERKEYEAKPHDSLESLGQEFFCRTEVCGENGKKAFCYIQKIRAEIKANSPQEFYTAKSISEVTHDNVVRLVEGLRRNGVCILDGEIEDVFIDRDVLPVGKKLSLQKIFQINRLLLDGRPIDEIVDCSILKEFLEKVLEK